MKDIVDEEKELNYVKIRLEKENHLIAERIRKLEELKEKYVFPYRFEKKNSNKELHDKYDYLKPEEHTEDIAVTAGRIMALRRMGKVTFMQISDTDDKIQLYFNEKEYPNYEDLKLLDLGDIIGVRGKIFKTRTGELTINVFELEVLSKAIRPLPEKYHGLQDTEIKYRQRYLDLIMDESSKKRFMMRTRIIKAIREFLDNKGFMEVENPIIQPIYGGAAAKPFTTHYNDLNMKAYLRISLELYLKRLIVGGYEKVYEMGKVFRNESIDTSHNPEFTLLEAYWAYADYNDIMDLVEDIYNYVALKVLGTTKIVYNNKEIDLKKPWKRITMNDALLEYSGIDVNKLSNDEIKKLLEENKINYRQDMSRGLLINQLFKIVEDKLIQPTFVIDHPKETTPLCRLHRQNPELIERFEPYINGWEIGNAYSELNDPIRQRYLLEQQAKELRAGIQDANPMDEDFCKAIDYGFPPTGGLGLGIDRMIMLFTNALSIRDVILFPTMKLHEETLQKGEK
ncbi:MAG: lysine--tRNA ligase [Candidatus Woesearchaeota archaeon]|nr:MAG: lysine--tRNA ligase [Candidatus Woesearchaeota archaeon]